MNADELTLDDVVVVNQFNDDWFGQQVTVLQFDRAGRAAVAMIGEPARWFPVEHLSWRPSDPRYRSNLTREQVVDVDVLARLMDTHSDRDGQWNGADICIAFAELIDARGGWKRCDDHGVYAATKVACPRCETDDD